MSKISGREKNVGNSRLADALAVVQNLAASIHIGTMVDHRALPAPSDPDGENAERPGPPCKSS